MGVGLALGLLALGPGLRRGFLLSYDMVAVPRESFTAAMSGLSGGPARAVPSDAVLAGLSRVVPADIAQKLLLLTIFVLACSGAAGLLDREPWFARLAAGVCYTWNPFVAERLIIGQWALLLGYAGLPWALRAAVARPVASWPGAGRLLAGLLPAAAGGFAAMSVSALVVLPAAVLGPGGAGRIPVRRRLASGAAALAVLAACSLPWLVPSLLRTVYADPAGVAAYAARADTPFGSLGSLLMLGGGWNAQTVPAGYGGGWSVLWLAFVIAAAAAYLAFGLRSRRWPGLGLAAAAGLAIAGIGVTGPGQDLLRAVSSLWPGAAILRDGQQFIAPLALAEALGAGLLAAWVATPGPLARRLGGYSRSAGGRGGLSRSAGGPAWDRRRRAGQHPLPGRRRTAGGGRAGRAGHRRGAAARAGAAAARARLGGRRAAAPRVVPSELAGRRSPDRHQPGPGECAAAALGGLSQPGLERRPHRAGPLAAAAVTAGDLERRPPGRRGRDAARRSGRPPAGRRPQPRRRTADRCAAGGWRAVRGRGQRTRPGPPPARIRRGVGAARPGGVPADRSGAVAPGPRGPADLQPEPRGQPCDAFVTFR